MRMRDVAVLRVMLLRWIGIMTKRCPPVKVVCLVAIFLGAVDVVERAAMSSLWPFRYQLSPRPELTSLHMREGRRRDPKSVCPCF
jgi:hypothetical protein